MSYRQLMAAMVFLSIMMIVPEIIILGQVTQPGAICPFDNGYATATS